MAKRPIEDKRRRRVAKMLTRQALPAHIDLIDWLQTRRHAQTAGAARKLILEGRVRVESHPLGRKEVPVLQEDGISIENEWKVFPLVPANLRDKITVW